MIGEWIRFGVTALCVVGGLFALLTALLGLFRFDYALNRLHAAALPTRWRWGWYCWASWWR